MLDLLYTDDIRIKTLLKKDTFSGNVYSTPFTIKGCLQSKTSQRTDNNGNQIVTDLLLHTKENLADTTLVEYNGKFREIKFKDIIKNHLMGYIDHYEYRL